MTEKRETENAVKKPEMVTVRLFKDDDKYKDDVVVAVNGKLYQIQRGIEVEVPAFVAEVLENSRKQDEEAARYLGNLSDTFKRRTDAIEK